MSSYLDEFDLDELSLLLNLLNKYMQSSVYWEYHKDHRQSTMRLFLDVSATICEQILKTEKKQD